MPFKAYCKRGHRRSPKNVQGVNRACKLCVQQYQKSDRYHEIMRVYKNSPKNKEYRHAFTRSTKGQYTALKSQAKRRHISLELTFAQFKQVRENYVCHYCSSPLSPAGTGLDRIDNDKGYSWENVLPCCADCNIHRSSSWTVDEMMEAVSAVKSHRLKRNNYVRTNQRPSSIFSEQNSSVGLHIKHIEPQP